VSAPQNDFRAWFRQATGHAPFHYQERLALEETLPQSVHVPTGFGKTAGAILGWLWRRREAREDVRVETPRRLVYCLPMRVLVEQTRDVANQWIDELVKKRILSERIPAHVLMGGEDSGEWDLYPERDAILIGTQDMLLSRALNRGYGMSRYRWPIEFGLLSNDCLWVLDEVQLMGSGLATATQLHAFRAGCGAMGTLKPAQTLWMSATLQRDWLKTVDFDPDKPAVISVELTTKDLSASAEAMNRWKARKPLQKAASRMGQARDLAEEVVAAKKPGSLTLVVINTVERAKETYRELVNTLSKSRTRPAPELLLIHSRFRPAERQEKITQLLAAPVAAGLIVVATQVIEAGVDVSAKTLFTELAPWASLVQRFGRCNRKGLDKDAAVYWLDVPAGKDAAAELSPPYELDQLGEARKALRNCKEVSPSSLKEQKVPMKFSPAHVLRRKDLLELFDTTPDLAGNDVDVSRFIRDGEDLDVQVFWRDIPEGHAPNPDEEAAKAPRREELCAVPVWQFRELLKGGQKTAYRWDVLRERWTRADAGRIFPGQVYVLPATAGGYDPALGWDTKADRRVEPLPPAVDALDSNNADRNAVADWQTIAAHTGEVCAELAGLAKRLGLSFSQLLELAARWHDRGKAHSSFMARLKKEALASVEARAKLKGELPAKAPYSAWRRGRRQREDAPEWRYGFRHELASALAVLQASPELISENDRGLIAFLVAAHHGKVRLSIRSLPEEDTAPDDRRFARGVWDADELPETNLGNGVIAPAVKLSLEAMELGQSENGQPSWAERMLTLRDHLELGPFRLAYLEALVRAADRRVSARAAQPQKVKS